MINNNFYKGSDLNQNNRENIKNYFNPYEYNLESNLKNQDKNYEYLRTECHSERKRKKA